ncbi:hypothetical protein AWC22_09855 [Mycobacterium riyadhense]|uniref:Uncharacterized protein n=2 Tax=Mycobacterium riyadhense TaxID=486698 RepID=A0A1X2DGH8_9MYCO|nr:hypothetical protein AWC22_09855 [Mycobacterium riyadhense]
MMRITIFTLGSRGDVQPYIGLGLGLKAAGHTVRVATNGDYAEFVSGYGLDFAPIKGDAYGLMQTDVGREAMERGNFLGFMHKAMQAMKPVADQMAIDALAACQDAHAIIATTTTTYPAATLAELLGIPYILSYPQPMLPTRDYQSMVVSSAPSWVGPLKGTYNLFSHRIMLQILWQIMRNPINQFRRAAGLSRLPLFASFRDVWNGEVAVLYCFSPRVVSPASDHGENIKVCGYWFADHAADWQPSPELMAFLEAGPAPIYIGFGSMTDRDPDALTNIVVDALAKSGQRGVLVSGWCGIGQQKLPGTVFVTDVAPHDWLFPKMAAVVHHGGAGTTAASLRAGVPTIIVPFLADQPFWGDRVSRLGVGPAPMPRKTLTADALANAIRTTVADNEMRSRAAALGDCIRAEDGVAVAVDMIERFVGR